MWNRRKRNLQQPKLNMFLEAIELDEGEGVTPDQLASQWKKYASSEEIPDEEMGKAFKDLGEGGVSEALKKAGLLASNEEAESVSDAAAETNEKVQDAEAEEGGEEPEAEPVEDEPVDDEEDVDVQQEAVGDSRVAMKAKEVLDMIGEKLDQEQSRSPQDLAKDPSWFQKLVAFMGNITEGEDADEDMEPSDEERFSEVDFVNEAADLIADEFKLEGAKKKSLRDILAKQVGDFRGSDPTFKKEEFCNAIANSNI